MIEAQTQITIACGDKKYAMRYDANKTDFRDVHLKLIKAIDRLGIKQGAVHITYPGEVRLFWGYTERLLVTAPPNPELYDDVI